MNQTVASWKCTECDIAYGTQAQAAKCHDGIGGVIESTQDAKARARMAGLRRIVETKSYSRVENVTVDLFSAQSVMQVYGSLRPELQDKLAAMPVAQMVSVTFKLLNKVGAR